MSNAFEMPDSLVEFVLGQTGHTLPLTGPLDDGGDEFFKNLVDRTPEEISWVNEQTMKAINWANCPKPTP